MAMMWRMSIFRLSSLSTALGYLGGDETILEREPREGVAADRELRASRHDGFWHPMETWRGRMTLERLWDSGKAPWKCW
ncbi:hypothetical protein GCM10009087_15560 [Sphingomonas oligophenolica]|uniref:Secreted protein n=1 Tax=Sphingomonas oligophenolica TaxID=301154 RepID=A0ABU9YC24_9SPHN